MFGVIVRCNLHIIYPASPNIISVIEILLRTIRTDVLRDVVKRTGKLWYNTEI